MRYRPIGKSGLKASVLGLGAWAIGGGKVWGRDSDDAESVRAIHCALDAGINLIDTAPAYGWGRSERIVGRAVRGRRGQVLIATKCGMWWEDARGSYFTEFDGKTLRRSVRPDTIQIEIEHSLRRLATDYVDLYQIHWPAAPPDLTPVSDTMACLLKLRDQGKIREIGVSNVTIAELLEYLRSGPIVSDQFRYSMLYRDPERDILPCCAEHEISTLTYMTLEQGLLTGKIGMDRVFARTEFRANDLWNPWFKPWNRSRVLQLLAGWLDLTRKYRCSLAQLVLAWTLAQPGVTHVLCGARAAAHAQENARAADIQLDGADLEAIRADVEAIGAPLVPGETVNAQ